MKKILRALGIVLGSLVALLILVAAILYFAAAGDYSVPPTVATDSTIPHMHRMRNQ